MRALALVACLALVPVVALAASGDPPPVVCVNKESFRATIWLEHSRDIFTDLAGPVEGYLIANLITFEARDHRGGDLVLVRQWGSPMTRIVAFHGGCRTADFELHNHYVQVLQRAPKEEGA